MIDCRLFLQSEIYCITIAQRHCFGMSLDSFIFSYESLVVCLENYFCSETFDVKEQEGEDFVHKSSGDDEKVDKMN